MQVYGVLFFQRLFTAWGSLSTLYEQSFGLAQTGVSNGSEWTINSWPKDKVPTVMRRMLNELL